jgi:hypothetical protein
VVLELAAVPRQVVQFDGIEPALAPGCELLLISVQMRDTVDFATAACSPSASVNAASHRGSTTRPRTRRSPATPGSWS